MATLSISPPSSPESDSSALQPAATPPRPPRAPSSPATPAPPPPGRTQALPRRPSLTVRTPSFQDASRSRAAQAGPAPSPTGSVVPAQEERQPAPKPPQQQPQEMQLKPGRPTPPLVPNRPPVGAAESKIPSARGAEPSAGAKGATPDATPSATPSATQDASRLVAGGAGARAGAKGDKTPSAMLRKSKASPMRPESKGTPARRARAKKKPPLSAEPGASAAAAPASAAAPGMVPAPPIEARDGGGAAGRPIRDTKAPARSTPPTRRMLDVEVVEAAGLLGTEKGGLSNPRADILLVDLAGRVVKSEGVNSSPVIKGTTNPVWNYKVSFGQKANLSSLGGNMPTLRVQVYSVPRFAAERPLGMVDIPLVNLSLEGEKWEQDYSLEPFGMLRAGGRLGSVRLKLKIGAVVDKRDSSTRLLTSLDRGFGDEEPGHEDQPPNFLRVTLHQAHELLAMDMGALSDPLVIFRLGDNEQRSAIVRQSVNPHWDQVFEFECRNSGESLEITVEDNDRFVNDFLGFVSILMGDLEDKRKTRQWYDLKLKTGELHPGEERGSIEITTQWFFNPKVAATKGVKKRTDFASVIHWTGDDDSDTEPEDESDDTDAGMDPNAQIAAREADPEEKKKKEDEKDALLKQLSDFKVVSGDYVAYVHIIEVRELKGEDLQGTSDPVVYVEAFGQKFATEVVKDRLNAVFDETFVINLRNLDQDDFKEGVFRISVMDADVTIGRLGSLKAELIGAVSFDATYVYFNKDHEVHRRWVALVDDENPEDAGIQGYLHLSIAIVGPGDRLKIHDEEADRRREKASADAGGLDVLVVMPPTVELQQKWLVTTVVKAEFLPVMDQAFGGGAGGGDFFFQVEVAGGKPFRTKKVSLTGDRHRLNPEWRSELWHPVTTPCTSGNVKYSIWDWDAVGMNELVAIFYGKLRHIERNTQETNGRVSSRWVNLYGPPLRIPETRNLKLLTRRAASLGLGELDYSLNQYRNFPHQASTYRGRVLVMERIAVHAPKGHEAHEKEKVAWRRKVKSPMLPKSVQYAMRLFVGSGTEIPQFTDITNFGKNKQMWLRISIGRYELTTNPVENVKGMCAWNQALRLSSNFNLPVDPDQVPDVFIHLMAGTGSYAEPCSFKRIPAKELINENFGGAPEWIRLKEDKVLDLLANNEFPGSVLVRIGLGPVESYAINKHKWKDEIQGLLKEDQYELRVHLYQARNLPSADSSGLIDPYLKIKFQGEVVNTENNVSLRRRATVDPIWYDTIRFRSTLPPVEYQRYFPQVTIQLFDYDIGFVDDYAGNLFLELHHLDIIQADRRTKSIPPPPPPEWKPFFMESPGDGQGELLVSVQLIHTKSAELPEPESIVPKTRTAHLDMLIMGIRNMQPYKYLPMQLPYCVFEVDDLDGTKRSVLTEPSNKPTGRDANFLQRIKMQLQLPLEDIYAPRIKIRVYDTRLGGFNVPLVGAGRIELGKKLPWNPEYEPPLAKTFAKDALLRVLASDGNDSTAGGDFEREDEKDEGSANGGSGRSGRSLRPGPRGMQFGSIDGFGSGDDSSEGGFSEFSRGPEKSGFGGGTFGTPSTRSVGRTSKRQFGLVTPSRSRQDFGGGVFPQSNWASSSFVDNTPQLSASGKVIDTGVGVMPALDLARQEAGLSIAGSQTHGSTPVGSGAAGEDGSGVGEDGTGGLGLGGTMDSEEEEDEFSQVPLYMKGRQVLEDKSLEEELAGTPFESYDLFRGQVLGTIGGVGTLKKVGRLKCIVRVTEGPPDDEPLFVEREHFSTLEEAKARNERILAQLLKPKGYKVRLYALQALNLTPMDTGIGGRPGKSDPYLRVKLGKETFNDKKNYIDDVTDADFYKCIEINCTLPGASQLEIAVMDYDDIGRDEFIGKTVIDLEDRWFDTRWQTWGLQNRSEDMSNMRFETKPVETRTLLVPTSLAPQGQLKCWLDIMSSEDARAFPPDDVSLPPNRDFEVRVVFWKCKNVVSMDMVTQQNDLFVRSWVEGCDPQETDTHWFAKKGMGTFNWRMKFKVSLGPRTRAWKFPYLTVQLWDRDLFKYNDHIAEGQLDLGPHFKKAYKTNETVMLFREIDHKLLAMQKADLENMNVDATLPGHDPANQRLLADLESGPVAYEPEKEVRPPPPNYDSAIRVGASVNSSAETVNGVNALYQGSPVVTQQLNGVAAGGDADRKMRKKTKKTKKKKKGCCAWICPCCWPGASGAAQVQPGDSDDEDEEAEADAKAFFESIKNFTGIGDSDPPESYWLEMERTNFQTRQKERMGKCLMGVQIWPIEKAEVLPVGNGRNDPNHQPFLPPPAGRLRFSLNPFVMGSELFGPKICAKICCACCCLISILLVVYFSGFFNLLLSLAVTAFNGSG